MPLEGTELENQWGQKQKQVTHPPYGNRFSADWRFQLHFDNKNAVVCVRHGQTIWKTEGRTQGQMDSPLTEIGIRQVHELAAKLNSEHFGVILSSSLGRAVQTAEILACKLDVKDLHKSDNLIEQCEGVFEGLTRVQQTERFPECFDSKTGQVISDSIPGVEPVADFIKRITLGLKEVRSFAETANILVVTHTGVLQALTSLILREDFVEVSSKRSFDFCDVLRLDLSQGED